MPLPQAVLVRAAGVRADAVDVAAEVLVGRFGPAEHDFDAGRPFVLFGREDLFVAGRFCASAVSFSRKPAIPSGWRARPSRSSTSSTKRNPQSTVDVGDVLEVLADRLGVELHAAEDLVVGPEEDASCRARGRGGPF